MGVTSQSRASHHNNMKVFVALAGLVAVTSAYPMFLLEDAEAAYAPVYRMARQVRPSQMADDFVPGSRFAEAARRRIQEEEDLETAADAAYGAAPVGRVKIQTYRGPSKGEGYDVFAPWGYYNTQPLDAGKHQNQEVMANLWNEI